MRHLIVWIAFISACGAYICGQIVDPDLWWHLAAGRWMLHHGVVPHVDYWNSFGIGEPWRAYSWSIEILLAGVDHLGGVHGLIALKIALALGFALTAGVVLARISGSWFLGALLGALVVFGSHDHFTLRPQTFVWVYFLALLGVLEGWLRGRIRQYYALLGCAAIMALWANAQITTIIGLIGGAGWVITERELTRPRPWLRLLVVVATVIVGTLITPYVGGEWLTFFSKSGHPLAFRAIAEFHPATIMYFPTAFTILLGALLLFGVATSPQSFPPVRLITAGMFALAGLAVVKFIPLALIFLAATIASGWYEMRRSGVVPFGNVGEGIVRLHRAIDRIPKEGLAFLLFAWGTVNVVQVWRAPLAAELFPGSAVDFIEREDLPHPVLNDFGRGGYLIYRYSGEDGVPAHLVSIDGRTNVGSHEVWEAYFAAESGAQDWKRYFDLVHPRTVLWRLESPLTSILLAGEEWCLVFRAESKGLMARAQSDRVLGFGVFLRRDEFERRAGSQGLVAENCAVAGER